MFQDPPKLNGNVWRDYTKQNYQNFEAYPYLKWDFFMEILFAGSIVSLSLQPVSSALWWYLLYLLEFDEDFLSLLTMSLFAQTKNWVK